MMKYLSDKEEKQLLRTAADVKGKKAERDSMILVLGFNTGLRLSEITGLNIGDVRGKDKLFVRPETTKATIRQADGTKKARGRMVPLSKKLQAAIKRFLSLKLTWREAISDDAPLFISKKGARLSARALQEVFAYWRDRAGLEHYTVHSMRHSFAKRILQRYENMAEALAVVQKLLGHTSLSSTGVYVEAGEEELREAVESR